MSLLVFAWLAFRVHEIRNRRAAVPDSMLEDTPNRCPKVAEFGLIQARSEPRGMNARLPQTFVRVDIADASQDALIEQQRFDSGAAARQRLAELPGGNIQRLSPSRSLKAPFSFGGHQENLAEAANIRVAKLVAVFELEKCVGMRRDGVRGPAHAQPAGHAEMDDQIELAFRVFGLGPGAQLQAR